MAVRHKFVIAHSPSELPQKKARKSFDTTTIREAVPYGADFSWLGRGVVTLGWRMMKFAPFLFSQNRMAYISKNHPSE